MHTLHSLPFHLEYDGEAQVSKGFPVTADEQDSSKFTASFRGRRLTGSIVPLPEDLQIYKMEREGDSVFVSQSLDSSKIKILEWNKEDVPERSKLSFATFSRFVSLQKKFNDLFDQ